jgi:hypothetical protein
VLIDAAGTGSNHYGLTLLDLGLTDAKSADFDGGTLMVSGTNGGIESEDVLSFALTDVSLSGVNDLPDDGETLTVDAIVIGTTVIDAPTFTSVASVSIAENTAAVIYLQASNGAFSEGAGLVYALAGGADQSLFGIDAEIGVLRFKTAPDLEPLGTDTVFDVTGSMSDSDLFTAQDLSVAMIDVNEAPTFNSAAAMTGLRSCQG